MADIQNISFKDAILGSSNSRPSILLGNGFSISLCENFNYKYLYKVAQKLSKEGNITISEDVKNLFKALHTCDFEKVLAYLNIAIQVAECYPNNEVFKAKLHSDRINLIDSFLITINSVHPKYKASLKTSTYISCLNLLSKFKNIFTTNYDVLLYWIIMERNSTLITLLEPDDFDISSLPKDDGFKRGQSTNELLIWDEFHEQRIQDLFYLHGSLFIIDAEDFYLKIDNNGSSILNQLEESLNSNHQPLIVLEGSSNDKANKIRKHPYLGFCLDALKNLKGNLFLLGFSINDKSDKHIIESIQESGIEKIFVGYYQAPTESFRKNIKQLAHINNSDQERELFIFNSNEAIDWEAIRLEDEDV